MYWLLAGWLSGWHWRVSLVLLHASDDDDHLLNSYFNHGVKKKVGFLACLFLLKQILSMEIRKLLFGYSYMHLSTESTLIGGRSSDFVFVKATPAS